VIRVNDANTDSASLAPSNSIGVERNDPEIKDSLSVNDLERERDENANNKNHRNLVDIDKHRGINHVNHVNHHITVVHLMTEQIEDPQQPSI